MKTQKGSKITVSVNGGFWVTQDSEGEIPDWIETWVKEIDGKMHFDVILHLEGKILVDESSWQRIKALAENFPDFAGADEMAYVNINGWLMQLRKVVEVG